jgi:hypothetical protein
MRGPVVALMVLLCATATHAASRRIALVVGANRGVGDDQPLRFAEADATRMACVLRELGGFAKEDVIELRTPNAAELLRTMALLTQLISDEVRAGRSPFLFFYFSGHADGSAVHTGGDSVRLSQITSWLRSSQAAVRLAVLDSCRSGVLTRVKGVYTAPAIEIRLDDELTTGGEVVLTSSTADELARESDRLSGSFFTHHLVSGLRGAADRSHDGRVTIAEAYDYAYEHTVAQANGGQHPTFKYDLAGRGDIVLTSLSEAGAWLNFGEGAASHFLILSDAGSVLGEVDTLSAPIKVGVAPGRYEVRQHGERGDRAVTVSLHRGEEHWIRDDELKPMPTPSYGEAKGDAKPIPNSIIITSERARAVDRQKHGIGYLVSGLVGLAPAFALLGTELGLNTAKSQEVFGPLFIAGLIASTSLIALGGVYVTDSSDELARIKLIPIDGTTNQEVFLKRFRGRAERRRFVGKGLLIGGFAATAVGVAMMGTGGGLLSYQYGSSELAILSVGTFLTSIGISVTSVGAALHHSGKRDLQTLDEGFLTSSPGPSASISPMILSNALCGKIGASGAGLSWSGQF